MIAVRGLTNIMDAVCCFRLIKHTDITVEFVFILAYEMGASEEDSFCPFPYLQEKNKRIALKKYVF